MNILDVQDKLKNLSEQQLVQEMQMPSGSAPQFLVLSEMSRRKRMRDDLTSAQQAPQRTVAEEAVAAAGVPQAGLGQMARAMAPQTDVTQNTGIGSLMPQAPVQGMAEGGEVGGPTVVRNGRRYTQLPNGMLIDAATGLPANPTSPQDEMLLGAQGFERRTGLPADIDAYLARPMDGDFWTTGVPPALTGYATHAGPPSHAARAEVGISPYQEDNVYDWTTGVPPALTGYATHAGPPSHAARADIDAYLARPMEGDFLLGAEGFERRTGLSADIDAYLARTAPENGDFLLGAEGFERRTGLPADIDAYLARTAPENGDFLLGAEGFERRTGLPADIDAYLNPPVPAPFYDFPPFPGRSGYGGDPDFGPNSLASIPEVLRGRVVFAPDGTMSFEMPPAPTLDESRAALSDTFMGAIEKDEDPTATEDPAAAKDAPVAPRLPGGPSGPSGSGSGSGASAAPVSSYEQELIDAMKRSEKRATQDKWLALAQAGLALMSSAQPTLGGAIGEAGLQGLGAFREGRDASEAERMKLLEAQYAVQMARQQATSSGGGGGGGSGFDLGDIKELVGLSASFGEQMATMTDMNGSPIPAMQDEYERAAAARAQLNNMIYNMSLYLFPQTGSGPAGATDDVDDIR
jgi:hypothetical protein